MEESNTTNIHSLTLHNKKDLTLTGVKKIDSFDHKEFLVETVMGFVHIVGTDLSIGTMNMDTGSLCIKGTIESISYVGKAKEEKESFFKKLFK